MGPCPKNADAVLANANKLTAAVVDDLAHERMAGLFLTSWATEPFRRIILTNAGVIVVCRIPGRADTAGFTIFPTFVALVHKKLYYPLRTGGTPRPFFFFFGSPPAAQKRGIGFRCRPTTLSAISRAVDGVGGRSNVPSHLTSPHASSGYSISALRRAPVELGPSTRGKFGANLRQISGRLRHWAEYLAPIDPRCTDCAV